MTDVSEQSRDEPGAIYVPPRRQWAARAALLGPNPDDYLISQDRDFLLENHLTAAERTAATLASEVAGNERELQTISKELRWTPAFTAAEGHAAVTRLNAALAAVLSIVCVIGMAVSNVVLSAYVLESASPLFANNTVGAVLFATLPSLASVALKVFEGKLTNPTVRWLYGTGLFIVGAASLATWMVATALTFAPDSGSALELLSTERSSTRTGVVLLLATVICEVAFGATILSGIGRLVAGQDIAASVPNPKHAAICRERSRLERLLIAARREHFQAEDYLSRAAAGRERTRLEAENELDRARELWTQAQTAALAFAIAMFLKVPEEEID